MNSRMIPLLLLCIALVNGNPLDSKRSFADDSVIIVDTPSKSSGPGGFPFRFPFERDDDDSMPSIFADDDDDEFFKHPIAFRPVGGGFGFDDSQMKNFWQRINEFIRDMQSKMHGEGEGTELGLLPPNYHNSTYETKNVNGSIITVNQTIDKQTDNNTQSYFHIKVVQVKPEKPVIEGTTETNNTPKKPEIPVFPEIKPEAVPGERTTETSLTPAEEAKKDDTPLVEENEP